jgi:uncharacterized membrane protein
MIKLNQPYTSLLPDFGQPKYYNAIDTENTDHSIQEPAMTPINNADAIANAEKERKEKERIERETNRLAEIKKREWENFKMNTHFAIIATIIVILLIIGLITLLFVLSILIGSLVILFNTMFENTMVFLFGRELYNKNFPICSDTNYSANGCYTTTNTYCS